MAVYDYDDEDDMNDSDLPKKLRAEIKRLQKENGDLAEKFDSLQKESRTRTVRETITAKGLNPKVAALIPADADVEEWLTEFGDVLGFAQPNADPAQEALAAESRRMDLTEQGSTPGQGDIMSAINNAQNMDELMAVIKSY